jgi:hypothetical protein
MFARRYLPVVAALLLAACATPPQQASRSTAPSAAYAAPGRLDASSYASTATPAERSVAQVIVCLKSGLKDWKIPEDYLLTRPLPGGGQSLALTNPATRKSGLTVEVQPGEPRPTVQLHENGAVVSAKWRNLIKRCAV